MERGAVVPAEAHGLWASWAAPGSPLRRSGVAIDQGYHPTRPEEDTEVDEMPPFSANERGGGAVKQVVMLLFGAVVGAALMFALGR